MKRILSVFLVMLICLACQARTFVLIVGVSSYQDSNNNLSQTTKDAKAFKEVIAHQTKDITILTSKYANKANIKEKLRALCNRATSKDKIIFFFSGHGYQGGIVAYDEAIEYQDINDILASSAAAAKICFVDACHAGTVNNVRDKAAKYKSPSAGNIIYLMSCRADELSMETPWIGHGFYTQSLLKGIRGKADSNKDKKITVKELFTYVYNDVLHSTAKMEKQQHPQLIGSKNVLNSVVADWN